MTLTRSAARVPQTSAAQYTGVFAEVPSLLCVLLTSDMFVCLPQEGELMATSTGEAAACTIHPSSVTLEGEEVGPPSMHRPGGQPVNSARPAKIAVQNSACTSCLPHGLPAPSRKQRFQI
jgi:hypothetical protein